MTVSAKNGYRIFFAAAWMLLALVCGCEPPEQAQTASSIRQSPDRYALRVLLDGHLAKANIKIGSQYSLTDLDTGRIIKQTSGPVTIIPTAEGIKAGQATFKTKKISIRPPADIPFTINGKSYRGWCELTKNDDGKTFAVINKVPMEAYLAGVVAAEMPSYWHSEALKAQAIAARTYCLFIKNNYGKNRKWDVKTTQANQVYKGIAAETIRTKNAVNDTYGMVLCCKQKSGNCELFPTYYSSVCGGHTEDTKNVFGDSYVSLKGVDCPYCKHITKPSLFYWPTATFNKKQVTERIFKRYPSLKNLKQIEKIEPLKVITYSKNFKRTVSVKLIGKNGKTGILRAEDMRLAIDPTGSKIQSTCCTIVSLSNEFMFIAGKGFGHGLGLCQYGAREMARRGKTAREILSYYYPESKIKSIY